MCNCNTNKAAQVAKSKTVYRVETPGVTKEFDDEPEARVFAAMHNGRIVIKSK
ncbi:MAG TPA: hypothetical protein VM533_02170 [Fimbriiglobus sp.]|jgi:hypothetical protein|nr:hypothetical protein [Fimbriiglobus sp.]